MSIKERKEKYKCSVEYPQIPPKVEYSMTEKGMEFIKILELMHEWGSKN